MVNKLCLLALWLALVAQRLGELRIARRHTRSLLKRGAREYGADHYWAMVALHTLWFVCWLIESWRCGCVPNPYWKVLLAMGVVGQFLRWSSIYTLGERWTTRVLVIPDEPRVRSGFYQWIPHPNYLGVVLELAFIPLIFGAWRTSVVFSLANAVLIAVRVRVEEEALGSI